jgi:hypothetical protein
MTKSKSISIVHRKTKGKSTMLQIAFAFGLIYQLNQRPKMSMNLIGDLALLEGFCLREG